MSTNNALNLGLSGSTGTGSFVGSNTPSIQTPLIKDFSNNPLLEFGSASSAVNYIQINNAATAASPVLEALGSDSNILMQIDGKGTSGVGIQGTSTNSNAVAGNVGQTIDSYVPSGSAISFTSTVTKNLTSISLTAGDWIVYGNIYFLGTTITTANVSINTVSATNGGSYFLSTVVGSATGTVTAISAPVRRLSLSATTTIYLVGQAYGTGSITGAGSLIGIRIR